jgi:hypothetical protein
VKIDIDSVKSKKMRKLTRKLEIWILLNLFNEFVCVINDQIRSFYDLAHVSHMIWYMCKNYYKTCMMWVLCRKTKTFPTNIQTRVKSEFLDFPAVGRIIIFYSLWRIFFFFWKLQIYIYNKALGTRSTKETQRTNTKGRIG